MEPDVCSPARIVVIEDSPELLELITIILRGAGHTVFPATGGLEGLELTLRERPHISKPVRAQKLPGQIELYLRKFATAKRP